MKALFKHNGRHVIATTIVCAQWHARGHDAAFQPDTIGRYVIRVFAEPHEEGPRG